MATFGNRILKVSSFIFDFLFFICQPRGLCHNEPHAAHVGDWAAHAAQAGEEATRDQTLDKEMRGDTQPLSFFYVN